MKDTLGVLLAGGAGERLYPLTRDRAKPAVTFGGIYRIIDITLSNCINSDLRRVYILTQYKALSLNRHIREGWNIVAREMGEFVEILPPMKRVSDNWYMGTADAVYQNIYSIGSEQPKHVMILSGDHIYKMDYGKMLEQHVHSASDVTLATIQIEPDESYRFGVVDIDKDHRVNGFQEKPQQTSLRSPWNPEKISASMGIYLFNTDVLIPVLLKDAEDPDSSHDFGKDILPKMVDEYRVYAYDFVDENKKEALYWRDVGTLEAYYEANLDIVSVSPVFNLYDEDWPIRTHQRQYPPAKFVFAEPGRMGSALDSIVSAGRIVSGSMVRNSFLRRRRSAAQDAGIEPQQYELMLAVKGLSPDKKPTIKQIAEQLRLQHHSTVELTTRLVKRGLIRRERSKDDRRSVLLSVTKEGQRAMDQVVQYSLDQLREEAPELLRTLARLVRKPQAR